MSAKNPFSIKSLNFCLNFDFFKFDSIRSHFNFESLTLESMKHTLTIEKIKTKVVQPFRYHYSRMLIQFIYVALILWSSIELITSLLYLMKDGFLFENELPNSDIHLDNFLYSFCKKNDCQIYLKYGLVYRAVAAAFLLAATIFVSEIESSERINLFLILK